MRLVIWIFLSNIMGKVGMLGSLFRATTKSGTRVDFQMLSGTRWGVTGPVVDGVD